MTLRPVPSWLARVLFLKIFSKGDNLFLYVQYKCIDFMT